MVRARKTTAEEAVNRIPHGAHVVASCGCGTPTTLLEALGLMATGRSWVLSSGFQLGGYPFLEAVTNGDLSFRTWHITPPVQPLVARGAAEYVPVRASQVAGFLTTWATDAALVRVSPPDRFGYCSLGPSVSYALAALDVASVRIAEVDETVPRTWGQSMVHESIFDVLVDSTRLMPEYPSVGATGVSRQIARHINGIVPPRPVLQLGIGSIPESLVELLADSDLSPLRFLGMATDAMVDIFERGRLDKSVVPRPAILTPELMGTRRLMDFSHDNPAVGLYPSSVSHSAGLLGEMERLVSINSAIEIDLSGDVNSEALHGRPVAGIGGSMDYVEAATRSKDGVRIIALPSTSSDGTSRIVDRLGPESPVTIPRSYVDYVVTEYGVARLAGLSLRERAEALLAIAHPAHVADLADAYERHPSGLRATADAPLAAQRVAVGAGRAVDEIVLPTESSEAQSASG